jgi:hypothetical protein
MRSVVHIELLKKFTAKKKKKIKASDRNVHVGKLETSINIMKRLAMFG